MCGIVGVFNIPNAHQQLISMLDGLPHRGENGSGMGLGERSRELLNFHSELPVTYLNEKLSNQDLTGYNCGLGHVRYGTAGDRGSQANLQPLMAKLAWGDILLTHNGDSPYMEEDKKNLVDRGQVFSTSSDSELMLHYMALAQFNDSVESIKEGLKSYRGTYAVAMLIRSENWIKLIAARDRYGNRPLMLGTLNDGFVVASEDVAFEKIGADYERDILPGEMIIISSEGIKSKNIYKDDINGPFYQCVYELIYFGHPTSKIFGVPIGTFRERIGYCLANRYGHLMQSGDVVTYVPDSANFYADGFCESIHRKKNTLIVRSHLTRSFIQENQKVREDTMRRKFNFMRHNIESIVLRNPNTRFWVIDDSIVRGNVSRKITRALKGIIRKALQGSGRTGVEPWVGWLSAAPAILGPCHKGIDMPGNDGKLIAAEFLHDGGLMPNTEEIAENIEADFVGYLPIQDLYDTLRKFGKDRNNFCFGCFENRDPIWRKW